MYMCRKNIVAVSARIMARIPAEDFAIKTGPHIRGNDVMKHFWKVHRFVRIRFHQKGKRLFSGTE